MNISLKKVTTPSTDIAEQQAQNILDECHLYWGVGTYGYRERIIKAFAPIFVQLNEQHNKLSNLKLEKVE